VTWGLLLAAAALSVPARADTPTERPARLIHPPNKAERDRREALKLYALGQMQERDSRLVDAVASYEEALRLDPESAVLRKAVVPLYLALDRLEDALKTCKEALDLDPGDYDTWFLYARQLRHEGRTLDAIDALRHALACPSLKDVPALRLQLTYDVGMLLENVQQFRQAAEAFTEVVALLDKPEPLVESGMFTPGGVDDPGGRNQRTAGTRLDPGRQTREGHRRLPQGPGEGSEPQETAAVQPGRSLPGGGEVRRRAGLPGDVPDDLAAGDRGV
jgi:tetratricopeptide (TPR) repeat protein